MEPGSFQITLKVFLEKDGEFLVLRDRDSGTGDLPGGRLGRDEFYEPWHRALEREFREELGEDVRYRLEEEPLFIFPHFVIKDQTEALGVAYRARYLGGKIVLSEEHDQMSWEKTDAYNPDGFFPPTLAAAVRRRLQEPDSGA